MSIFGLMTTTPVAVATSAKCATAATKSLSSKNRGCVWVLQQVSLCLACLRGLLLTQSLSLAALLWDVLRALWILSCHVPYFSELLLHVLHVRSLLPRGGFSRCFQKIQCFECRCLSSEEALQETSVTVFLPNCFQDCFVHS